MPQSVKKSIPAKNDHLKKVVVFSILAKVLVFLVIVITPFFFAFRTDNYLANFHYPFDALPNFWTHFKTWDAQHYLFLAENGYAAGQSSNVFPPLFPFLIHS